MNASEAFDLIVQAALAGERCPQNEPLGPLPVRAVTELVRAGKIIVYIHNKNYRVIEIRHGEHIGRTTRMPDTKSKPWRVIRKEGNFLNGRGERSHKKRPLPSTPRDLSGGY